MSDALIVVFVVVGGYLAAHVAFEWLGRRLLVVSGAEYLLLGILLGPQVSNVLNPGLVESFAPVIALALGWMGALVGSRLRIQMLVRVPGLPYRLAFAESLTTLFIVAGLEYFLLQAVFGISGRESLVPALALGALATASSDAGVELAAKKLAAHGPVLMQLRVSAATNAFVAICAFGLLLAIWHATPSGVARPITPTEWTVITIGIGLIGGGLFYLFLGSAGKVDRLFVSLSGVIILVSGAATYLRLSPVMAGMFFSAVLVNTSRQREEITAALARVERPLYFVLLIFAGATWTPSARLWILPVTVFLAARALSKVGASRLASRANGALEGLGPDWGRGLLGQGGLALALALNYLHHDTLPLPNIVFTAAVASVLLTDLFSGRLAESVLARGTLRRAVVEHVPGAHR